MVTSRTLLRLAVVAITIVASAMAIRSFAPQAQAAFALLARRAGATEFALYVSYSLAVFALPGVAWWVTTGQPTRRIGAFVWGRLVREAAADLLPFSQVGGIILGAAEVASRDIPLALVYASFVADLMTELAAQLVFTAVGVAIVFASADGPPAALPLAAILGGTGALAVLIAVLAFAPATLTVARALARRVVPASVPIIDDGTTSLRAIHARPAGLVASFALNLTAWFASAAGAFVALRLIGVDVPFWPIIALESLIFLLRSTAFVVPAGLGIQEAGYGLLGPLFGLPVETVLALVLLKRARDLAIAVPVLVAWQAYHVVGRRRGPGHRSTAMRSRFDPTAR